MDDVGFRRKPGCFIKTIGLFGVTNCGLLQVDAGQSVNFFCWIFQLSPPMSHPLFGSMIQATTSVIISYLLPSAYRFTRNNSVKPS